MSWYYLSDWGGLGTRDFPITPNAFPLIVAAGGQGAVWDLRTDCTRLAGFGLVGSTVLIPAPPANVSLLFDDTLLDSVVPGATVTKLNSALGITLDAGITFRAALRALATVWGGGRWGKIQTDRFDGSIRLHLGAAGSVTL